MGAIVRREKALDFSARNSRLQNWFASLDGNRSRCFSVTESTVFLGISLRQPDGTRSFAGAG
jgi:hypothetical protein